MVGWHHQLNAHGSGWTLGVCDGQGGLVCCSPWGHKDLDMTENTELNCVCEERKKNRSTCFWRFINHENMVMKNQGKYKREKVKTEKRMKRMSGIEL